MQTGTIVPRPGTGRFGRRGAIGKGCAIAIAVVVIFVVFTGGCVASKYNSIVSNEVSVEAAFTEIDNQYQRRADLIGQLVDVVKGAAEFEERVLTEIVAARASVGQTKVPESIARDPAALEQYFEAQRGLGSAFSRLMVVVENYPTLKTSANFLDLQTNVEGTENRIAVARRDYIDAVKSYNGTVRRFPGNVIAGFFGFERLPQLEFDDPTIRERPKIDVGGGK